MGYGEKREDKLGSYWRGRYRIDLGKWGTLKDPTGAALRLRTRRAAEKAANEYEVKIREEALRDAVEPNRGQSSRETFRSYASRWYADQDLAPSTMENYRLHIEGHLLPAFEDEAVADISESGIRSWEKRERSADYAESSIKTWRSTLHLILADAKEEGLTESNPADRRRGRGRRAGRSRARGPEKAVTTPLGILLLAERASLLSGRDDEFVAVVTKGYTGMRFGELVGLESQFVRPASIRVEWQLYELDSGELYRQAPKDDSHRTVDTPEWHSALISDHINRLRPQSCKCHGKKYVFSGYRAANAAGRRAGPKLMDVARRAGVSTGTVSNFLNRPESVAESTRGRVQLAIEELGYIPGGQSGELAAHWRRNSFSTWLFQPAATGWYPRKAPQDPHPVPILGEPWPGVPARGRGAAARADACWVPIARGLTPHGLRHTHKTLMVELGTPAVLMDDRLGHSDGSVQARYSHITAVMRRALMDGLTAMWEDALAVRRTMSEGSPVSVLDRLLRAES